MKITYKSLDSTEEVEKAFQFITEQLEIGEKHPRQLDYYLLVHKTHPSLLMVAKNQDQIIGCTFSSKNQFKPEAKDELLIGEVCVHPNFQGQNIGRTLLMKVEKNAKKIGFKKLILGAKEGVESFYFKCEFVANLHIQIENDHCLEELKNLNSKYEIIDEEVKEGWTRVLIKTKQLDRQLENSYKKKSPKIYLNYVFTKEI
ncbi:hypothetical protein NEF87_005105 [Candidatus Lokiarchaeum ossiferum]|uniref:N-acetyltransferase domain-containing protein n=1 Tax=Candidatus Lokiarchaeum ossiferum TaxID=2951803 RepID=A0ABY6HZ68_9ARCH|nr:hypothetical protein NEF87_005105 [Candidatus Lokiarchaeum sp. B-35]